MSPNIPKRKNKLMWQTFPQHILDLIRQWNEVRRLWQRHDANKEYKCEKNRLKIQIGIAIQEDKSPKSK